MAETTGEATVPVTETPQPQVGTSPPSQVEGAQTAQAASAAAEGGTDIAALRRELEEARRETAKYRTEARKLSEAQKAAEDAKLTEDQRLAKRVQELEAERTQLIAERQERTVRLAAVEAATRLGFRSPDLAFRLLDQSAIEFKDDGSPRNVERLLKDILEREPYLAKSAAPDYGGGNRGATPLKTDNVNDLLRAAVRGHT